MPCSRNIFSDCAMVMPPVCEADGGEEAHVAQQRFAELADVHLGRRAVEAGVEHHFLGVVRPTLGERIADEQLPELPPGAVGMQELQEVARPPSCAEVNSSADLPGT